jgi:hypothetical protein
VLYVSSEAGEGGKILVCVSNEEEFVRTIDQLQYKLGRFDVRGKFPKTRIPVGGTLDANIVVDKYYET